MPNVIGMGCGAAMSLLSNRRFVIGTTGARACSGAVVIGQSPPPLSFAAPRATVTVMLKALANAHSARGGTGPASNSAG